MIPKFRGRCPDGGWVHGSCLKFDENTCFIMPEFDGASILSYAQIFNHTAQYVDIETIAQSTGLKDENGVEIYGGDIVLFTIEDGFDYVYGKPGEITLSSIWGAGVRSISKVNYSLRECREVKIIGNIYENPELLNVR